MGGGRNDCLTRITGGVAIGCAVGGAVGAVYGTYEAIRYKVSPKLFHLCLVLILRPMHMHVWGVDKNQWLVILTVAVGSIFLLLYFITKEPS